MRTPSGGRPPASSREVLADAALELFLERGYEATSVVEITRRAGVSRASFFNYFANKGQILWFVLDDRLAALDAALAQTETSWEAALAVAAQGERPDALALAIVDARTMGVEAELLLGRAERQRRVAAAMTSRLVREGEAALAAEIRAGAFAAALFAAVWAWALRGAGQFSLNDEIAQAFAEATRLLVAR